MGITNVSTILNREQIDCNGSVKITLSLHAVPDIETSDIVLVLDRSSRMDGAPLENMKQGALNLVNQLYQTVTDANEPNRIALVSFGTLATVNVPFGGTLPALEKAITELTPQGEANHADALTKAMQLFDRGKKRDKIIVLFTNLDATLGASATSVAQASKKAGITIYCLGLGNAESPNVDAITGWASVPASTHVFITPDPDKLQSRFTELAHTLQKPGATGINISGMLKPDFIITSILEPNRGITFMPNQKKLCWTIDELSTAAEETAVLEFFVQYTGSSSGVKEIFKSLTYRDEDKHPVTFPTPTITVTCRGTGSIIFPEPCPDPIDVTINPCEDSILFDLGDVYLDSLGRILQFDLTIKDVCPHRRVALAIILTENDDMGVPQPRGMKTVTIPAHYGYRCKDVIVRCIKFVVPEEPDEEGMTTLCRRRNFKVQLIAHYIDTDFVCCPDSPEPEPDPEPEKPDIDILTC